MKVQKAGCILIDISNKKIGLIYRKQYNDYSFPKGHLEPNETLEECAIRETEEETGRRCSIITTEELPIIEYTDSVGNSVIAHYYLAKDLGKSEKIFDESLVHEIVWVPIDEVEKKLTYSNLVEFWNTIKLNAIDILKGK